MKHSWYAKTANRGYTVALTLFVIAGILFVLGWTPLGSAAAFMMFLVAIETASVHGHLSKRGKE